MRDLCFCSNYFTFEKVKDLLNDYIASGYYDHEDLININYSEICEESEIEYNEINIKIINICVELFKVLI